MAFKKSESVTDISTGSDNWNVADGYSKLKILRHLILLDRYDTIAQFGTEDISEGDMLDGNQINKRRVEGLERFRSVLLQLIGNTYFAVKPNDKAKVTALSNRVKNCDEYINKTFKANQDLITKEEMFEIKEVMFKKILKIFQEVKDELNILLNNANLIFRPSEEMDLQAIMDEIVQGG